MGRATVFSKWKNKGYAEVSVQFSIKVGGLVVYLHKRMSRTEAVVQVPDKYYGRMWRMDLSESCR